MERSVNKRAARTIDEIDTDGQRIDEIDTDGQRIAALDTVVTRLEGIDADFHRLRSIVAQLEPFEQRFRALSEQIERLVQEHSEKAQTLADYDQTLKEAGSRGLETLGRVIADAREQSEAMAKRLELLDQQVTSALADLQTTASQWQATTLQTVVQRLSEGQSQLASAHGEFRSAVEARLRDFEIEQYRKLDDVQQAYTLVSNRQREAEDATRRQLDRLQLDVSEAHKRTARPRVACELIQWRSSLKSLFWRNELPHSIISCVSDPGLAARWSSS